jgi:cytochrome P450 family 6
MLSLEGQEWRDRRVKLSPIFTSGKMKMMFETVDTIADKLVEVLNAKLVNSESLDVRLWAAKFTADVIGWFSK